MQDISTERRREEKLQFLAEASDVLTASLDDEETLRKLAALTVPRLADWCSIEMLQGEGRSQQLAVAHVAPVEGLARQDAPRAVSAGVEPAVWPPVEVQVDCNSPPTVRVRDHGPGIPPEEQERIFEGFERGRQAESQSGIGLGL